MSRPFVPVSLPLASLSLVSCVLERQRDKEARGKETGTKGRDIRNKETRDKETRDKDTGHRRQETKRREAKRREQRDVTYETKRRGTKGRGPFYQRGERQVSCLLSLVSCVLERHRDKDTGHRTQVSLSFCLSSLRLFALNGTNSSLCSGPNKKSSPF